MVSLKSNSSRYPVTKIKRAACAYWDERLPIGLENQAADFSALVDHYTF